jgi:hypothetical protein
LICAYAVQVLLQTAEAPDHLVVDIVVVAHVLNGFRGLEELLLEFLVLPLVLFIALFGIGATLIVRFDQVRGYRPKVLT